MAEQQQQEYHDRANGWPPARQPPLNPSGGLDVFIVERHISQVPMRDDPQERVTIDSVSNSRAATNSVWPCESMRDTHESIREVNGRQYNAQNTTYFLPADKIEYGRLGKQHILFRVAIGDELYPHPEMVEVILQSEPGVEKKVLDLGCGSGIWTISMASKFPHVKVIGVDLAPAILNEYAIPDNCGFELGDVNLGLPRFYDQIDLIHMRSISSGITNFAATVKELVKCLKPGGMLILSEGDVEWHKEDQAHLAVLADPNCPDLTQPGKTWIGQNVNEARKAMVARGSDVMQAMQLIDHGLWDHPAIDPDSCGVIAAFAPIGPWPQSANHEEQQRLSMVGTLSGQNFREISGGVKNILLEQDIPEHVIDHWQHMAELELQSCDVVSLWNIFRYAWGRKLLADGTTAAHIPLRGLAYRPIPPHLGGQVPPHDPFGPYGKYPLAHYYPTAERARQWMEWKAMERARLGHEPRPDPVPWQ